MADGIEVRYDDKVVFGVVFPEDEVLFQAGMTYIEQCGVDDYFVCDADPELWNGSMQKLLEAFCVMWDVTEGTVVFMKAHDLKKIGFDNLNGATLEHFTRDILSADEYQLDLPAVEVCQFPLMGDVETLDILSWLPQNGTANPLYGEYGAALEYELARHLILVGGDDFDVDGEQEESVTYVGALLNPAHQWSLCFKRNADHFEKGTFVGQVKFWPGVVGSLKGVENAVKWQKIYFCPKGRAVLPNVKGWFDANAFASRNKLLDIMCEAIIKQGLSGVVEFEFKDVKEPIEMLYSIE